MTTVHGCETYDCPNCGEQVKATVYGSINSWSYPGSQVASSGRLVNGAFGSGVRDLRCSKGHEFTSEQIELREVEDYRHTPTIGTYSLITRLWRRLRS